MDFNSAARLDQRLIKINGLPLRDKRERPQVSPVDRLLTRAALTKSLEL
jgi:hypothetical protein